MCALKSIDILCDLEKRDNSTNVAHPSVPQLSGVLAFSQRVVSRTVSKQVTYVYCNLCEFVVVVQKVLMEVDIMFPSVVLLLTVGWTTVVVFYETRTKEDVCFFSLLGPGD